MADVLKGNFDTKKTVAVEADKEENLEERFEREAKKRLGGSIAFVSRKKVMWSEENQD
jgi:hypothetical protein